MNKIFIAALPIIIACSACKQQPAKNAGGDTVKTAVKARPANDTVAIFNNYLILKNDLVKADANAAKAAAASLQSSLGKLKGCAQTATTAAQISASADLKQQRKAFLLLSSDVIALMKGARLKNMHAYVDYCPMAGGGKGGFWLSSAKAIENPYFGDDMKECGEVKEEIK